MMNININNVEVGDKNRSFIIAELSANHNGSLEVACDTIKAAKRAGADAIKLQTYTADTITLDVKSEEFKINHGTAWDGKYLYELYQEACTPWEWHKELFKIAKDEGLICFSSPFDKTAVDFLEQFNPPAYKIGETVSILYDPEDPSKVRADSFLMLWLLPILIIAMGIVSIIIGTVFIFMGRRKICEMEADEQT